MNIILGKAQIDIVEHNETFSIKICNYSDLSIKNLIKMEHLKRVMKKYCELSQDMYIDKLREVYKDVYWYCTHSGDKLDISIGSPVTSEKFTDKYYHYVTNNTVMDRYNTDPETLSLLLCLGLCALSNPRLVEVVNNIPKGLNAAIGYNINNVTDLYDKIKSSTNDIDLAKKIGMNAYGVIKYLLSLNKMQISSIDNEIIKDDKMIMPKSESTHIFMIDYPKSVSERFDSESPSFLYHGSSFDNWFQIVNNGLKNLSGTNLMVNGQVHGPGVYLTNSYITSTGYGSSRNAATTLKTTAVVQVIGDRDQYKKVNGIYVVPDDKDVLLRYLIVTHNSVQPEVIKYLTVDRVGIMKTNAISMAKIAAKRITKDTKEITKHLKKCGYDVEINDDATITVKVCGYYEFIIKFPSTYPIDYPEFFIKCPIINKCYVIDDGGSLIVPEFTRRRWTPKIKVYRVIRDIIRDIVGSYTTKDGEYTDDYRTTDTYTKFIRSVVYV